MAIDTRNKRFSILNFAAGDDDAPVLPNPDGSLATAADRAQLMGLYNAVPAAGSPPVTANADWQHRAGWRRVRYRRSLVAIPGDLPTTFLVDHGRLDHDYVG